MYACTIIFPTDFQQERMKKLSRIAILGSGFSGLAAAYLLAKESANGALFAIDIYDPNELGDNASGIAAGLLHSYPGAKALLSYRGIEGRLATLELVKVAEKALDKQIALPQGMLRIAISDEQKKDYFESAHRNPDVHWLQASECLAKYSHLPHEPGIFVESAVLIRTKLYLEGLWNACKALGVSLKKERILSLAALDSYDAIVVACGAEVTSIRELSTLPIKPLKGQILKYRLPNSLPSLPCPINSKAYLVQEEGTRELLVGATFERKFQDINPDPEFALAYLKDKMTAVIPELEEAKLLDCKAAVRAQAPNHLPFLQRFDNKTWVIAGMGSRGLLYHALCAKEAAAGILKEIS